MMRQGYRGDGAAAFPLIYGGYACPMIVGCSGVHAMTGMLCLREITHLGADLLHQQTEGALHQRMVVGVLGDGK